ncbi:acyl-protein synthetase [bacterium]|jgi:phenylacetate-coenzyme A ligase PaaK-like adenylate-forming protein|nr:acyl-protein synthetase [bacterium]
MINFKDIFKYEPFSMDWKKKEDWYFKNLKKLTTHHIRNSYDYHKISNSLFSRKNSWKKISDLPYLHVSAFKDYSMKSISDKNVTSTYNSSGTTSSKKSKIFLDRDTSLLQTQALKKIFQDVLKNKKELLIVDSKYNVEKKFSFSAKKAAIRGFSINFDKKNYLLDSNNNIKISELLKLNNKKNFVIFGFTSQIWFNLIEQMKKYKILLKKNNGIVIHGGGWKKMQNKSINNNKFKEELKSILGVKHVFNYYGMIEQTGSVFIECEKGFFHSSIFSDILFRDKFLNVSKSKKVGLVQIMSLLPISYPGHNILTEDIGKLEGIDDCECGKKGKYFSILGRVKDAELRGCSDV